MNWAWSHYGADWVQLAPPRHFVIHSQNSFRLTVEAAGFEVTKTIFDSQDIQFYGSELYRRDIPLFDTRAREIFSPVEIQEFRHHADRLNQEKLGDQAAFFLKSK